MVKKVKKLTFNAFISMPTCKYCGKNVPSLTITKAKTICWECADNE